MSRLTERDEYGNANIIGVDSQDLQMNLEYDQFEDVTSALNRLADFEDMCFDNSGKQVLQAYRLRELAEAEREGRIRIGSDWTPCAEGLPTKKGYYLATVEWFVNEKLRRHVTIKRFDPKSENNLGWHVELTVFGERVLAWQPLPAAWKEPENV